MSSLLKTDPPFEWGHSVGFRFVYPQWPQANAEFIRLADQHVEVPGGKNVLPGEVWGEIPEVSVVNTLR